MKNISKGDILTFVALAFVASVIVFGGRYLIVGFCEMNRTILLMQTQAEKATARERVLNNLLKQVTDEQEAENKEENSEGVETNGIIEFRGIKTVLKF